MWKRATWHECADELDQVSRSFRRAYWSHDEAEMLENSRIGVELLRALALAVRSEQDFDLAPDAPVVVGALKADCACPSEAIDVKRDRGYESVLARAGYSPLHLREALNKIAHADPRSADYYVSPQDGAHDLLLYGSQRGLDWFAAVSILRIVDAIRSLPDASVRETAT